MSISAAFSNALSGLGASSRLAQIVSANVANAMTDGYGRKTLGLSSASVGGVGAGVRIDGVSREVNQGLLADRRLSNAAVGAAGVKSGFFKSVERTLGAPTEADSLSSKIAAFESALIEASAGPESPIRLSNVVRTAQGVTQHLNKTSDVIGDARFRADQDIDRQVSLLNKTIKQVDKLNDQILRSTANGRDASGLMDQRQVVVDQIAQIVPLKIFMRDNSQIALFTTHGATLLDGQPSEIGFEAAGRMAPHFSIDTGFLSGLTLNGEMVRPDETGLLGGGSLSASFELRDKLTVEAQSQVDAIARDLIERLADASVDPTYNAGSAGFFTDAGQPLDPADEIGLSGRISVNALVDPTEGGELWRLRDGLAASAPGDVGNNSFLSNISDALADARTPASGGFGPATRSASGLIDNLLSQYSTERQNAELSQTFATAQQETLREEELRRGVDTDQELQTLLQVEQAYAANARVMQTLDGLLRDLLEI